MEGKYTDEKNATMLLSLMKQHGVKKVVASPGATNISFVISCQRDPYFEVYSSVDERSAAYMACGLAEQSGEPVALSCTQATASRNYYPALTEAYYRKLPVLAVTSTQHAVRIGQNVQQAIDRTVQPLDTLRLSVQVPIIESKDDASYANLAINRALLELRRNGGGPVHINLTTTYSMTYDVQELPHARAIYRYSIHDVLPAIDDGFRVAVYVGAHSLWSHELTNAVDSFCEAYDACVFCDQTSNYWGKYRVNSSLLFNQVGHVSEVENVDLLIHIGNTAGSVIPRKTKRVWRVNPDGEVRDTFGLLQNVFEMTELDFFSAYARKKCDVFKTSYFDRCVNAAEGMVNRVPNLPLSNAWIAQQTLPLLPEGSVLHMGIYNSLRAWSLFEGSRIAGYCNTGGFGIDGCLSSLIGASLASSKPCFGVVGDLAFFYDMNALGNRHVGNNLRIILVNNGCGTEFKGHISRAYPLGEEADQFVAARGHFGKQSPDLVRHYAQDLGFEYHSVHSKQEYLSILSRFVTEEELEAPILIEVFTSSEDETTALKMLYGIETDAVNTTKQAIKHLIGDKKIKTIKRMISK